MSRCSNNLQRGCSRRLRHADEYADAYWTEVAYGPQDKCEVSVLTGIDGPAGDVRDEEDARRGAEDPGSTTRRLWGGKITTEGGTGGGVHQRLPGGGGWFG
jgi:hypothetical protein